jgi:MSHA pilin protein MshD
MRTTSQPRAARARGATLVEVVIFIVVISIAVSSILGLLSLAVGRSGDPLVIRQSLAAAESLMQEIMSQPYTAKDPDDPTVDEAIGPEAGEARGSSSKPFDNVNDYDGLVLNGISNADGTAIAGLEQYNATVSVQSVAMGAIVASEGLLVSVTVTGPGGVPVTLHGYRARYAP